MKNLKEVKQLWEKELKAFVKDNLFEGSKGQTKIERENPNDLIVSHDMTQEKILVFADSFMYEHNLTDKEFTTIFNETQEPFEYDGTTVMLFLPLLDVKEDHNK